MPLYEYQCKKCDDSFEVLQRVGETKAECPSCGSKKTEKLLSMFSNSSGGSSGGGGGCVPSFGGG